MLSPADHAMAWDEPAFQSSPPFGDVTTTVGSAVSIAVPELVKVSANVGPRTVSTPPGSHVAEMTMWPLATLSHAGLGAAPAPVSVQ